MNILSVHMCTYVFRQVGKLNYSGCQPTKSLKLFLYLFFLFDRCTFILHVIMYSYLTKPLKSLAMSDDNIIKENIRRYYRFICHNVYCVF